MGKLTQLLSHPYELLSVIQMKAFRKPLHKRDPSRLSATLNRCYELLFMTSRSFAVVIDELHPELKDVVMLFYLLLRALDTVEDDMSIDPKVKVAWLKNFTNLLSLQQYSYDEVNKKEKDRVVLVEFTAILTEFHKLKPEYQDILKDISGRMGEGMAKYILDDQFNTDGVATNKDFDLYCHYVAGIVGEGLTRLAILANFADESLSQDNFHKANEMGLFLQKTNIIRDFNEDYRDGRSFYPKEVWSKYTDKLFNFAIKDNEQYKKQGVFCINELVLNALHHADNVLLYLSMVKDPSTFSFCAIPQVMAIATLELVYNNPDVLYTNVKIRRGLTCRLMLESRTFHGVVSIFRTYLRKIHRKVSVYDPNYFEICARISKLEQLCDTWFPNPKFVPKGAVPTNKYASIIAARTPIDNQVQKSVNSEIRKLYLSLSAVIILLGSIVYILF